VGGGGRWLRRPLDLRAPFAKLGGSLLRSPRSPRTRSRDSHRLGLGGLVDDDALAEPAAASNNRLFGPQARQPFKLPQRLAKPLTTTQPRDCAHASPELGNVGTAASCKPVPCSRSYGDVKSGPEVTVPGGAPPGASSHHADLGKFPAPGSLPASIGGPRRYVGSVSATEAEQSEDYTCIIAHGPNPKTTRIFGDCILEPCTLGDGVDAMEVKEGAESAPVGPAWPQQRLASAPAAATAGVREPSAYVTWCGKGFSTNVL